MRLFFLGVLVLAGCAAPKPPVWVKTGPGPADSRQASAECEYQSAAATQQTDSTMRGGLAAVVDQGMRKDKLMVLCMRSKGFEIAKR